MLNKITNNVVFVGIVFWAALVLPAKTLSHASDVDLSLTENQIALQNFREKAAKIQDFMSTKKTILVKQNFSESPTGLSYHYARIKLVDISLDVQKSNSLISPLVGYIYLTHTREENKGCGDLVDASKYGTAYYGYSTYEKALVYKQDCFRSYPREFELTNPYPYPNVSTKLVFSYQNNHWIFKDAILPENNSQYQFWLATVGKPALPWYRSADNQSWEDLMN
jgi:hypothetical protein